MGNGCDIVCVIAARGGAEFGNEEDDLARKRAVEAGAIVLVGGLGFGVCVSIEASSGVDGGPEGIGSVGRVKMVAVSRGSDTVLKSARKPAPGTPSFKRASAICSAYSVRAPYVQRCGHTSQAEYASRALICSADMIFRVVVKEQ